MPYLMIEDFSGGLDLRKSEITARPNTLRTLTNGFITSGGEIEKRQKLTSLGTLPAGLTFGLGFTDDKIVVFGTQDPVAALTLLPANVVYHQLKTVKTVSRILDVQRFGLYLYVVARMSDGSIENFYNSNKVTALQLTRARAHKSKLYGINGQNLYFSSIRDATNWSGTGSGIVDVTTEDGGEVQLIGLEQYYSFLALFARDSVQIWQMDPDPAANAIQQTLGNIGLVAPKALSRYGNGDVLFLSHTGIRSLRARDSSNAAVLNDIGSPVDDLVKTLRRDLSSSVVDRIAALVDPLSGHFWLCWGQTVILFSYYPNSKVSAWSTFDLGVQADYVTLAGSRIVVRSGDDLYLYGATPVAGSPFDPNSPLGPEETAYDGTVVEIVTPMLSLEQPATVKDWQGLDVACTGAWTIYANPSFEAPGAWVHIADIEDSTFDEGRIPVDMSSTHMAFRFVSSGTGKNKLSAIGVHHSPGASS